MKVRGFFSIMLATSHLAVAGCVQCTGGTVITMCRLACSVAGCVQCTGGTVITMCRLACSVAGWVQCTGELSQPSEACMFSRWLGALYEGTVTTMRGLQIQSLGWCSCHGTM